MLFLKSFVNYLFDSKSASHFSVPLLSSVRWGVPLEMVMQVLGVTSSWCKANPMLNLAAYSLLITLTLPHPMQDEILIFQGFLKYNIEIIYFNVNERSMRGKLFFFPKFLY